MGKIVVSANISVDGVTQDPTGEEGFSRGGWFTRIGDVDRQGWTELALEEALGAAALLLGRRSYEYFAARWPSRGGQLADTLNALPKYVVSTTLDDPGWNNSTILHGDAVDEVSTLKHAVNGNILVYASSQLVHTLIEHDLVDELRLMIYPVVLGAGNRLFNQTNDTKPLRLVGTRIVGSGLALLTYQRTRDTEKPPHE